MSGSAARLAAPALAWVAEAEAAAQALAAVPRAPAAAAPIEAQPGARPVVVPAPAEAPGLAEAMVQRRGPEQAVPVQVAEVAPVWASAEATASRLAAPGSRAAQKWQWEPGSGNHRWRRR